MQSELVLIPFAILAAAMAPVAAGVLYMYAHRLTGRDPLDVIETVDDGGEG